MLYLVNAFSLNMLPANVGSGQLSFRRLGLDDARAEIDNAVANTGICNAIGHADTDRIVREALASPLAEGQRTNVTLETGDEALVAQYIGPRLAEGATSLPDGARIEWILVRRLSY